jgi:hypothetical protein
VFLWGRQKRCVELLAQEKGCACGECGSHALTAPEAEWSFGRVPGGELNVYLKCSNCRSETTLTLPPEEYRRCGFDPDEGLPGTP